ncbi:MULTISPECIES: hypothetical protein [unclassified Streptomyces]|uniref:hypothetical protein n=1 Tax=unclassified Streptomyces TaxID=2593676 RepID=UPI001F326DAE|nr:MULTISPECIES: hypothetical protein [unclassified Streptomyces]WKX23241.1 hypothetical protein Q3Y68_36385 [Streptomyces sp. HUAS CX7]
MAKLPVLQGQLVDGADEGFAVGAEFGALLPICCAEFLEFHDLFAQSYFSFGRLGLLADCGVEIAFQIRVALGECVAGDLGFLGEGDDGQGAVGVRCGAVPVRMRSMAARMRSRSFSVGLTGRLVPGW